LQVGDPHRVRGGLAHRHEVPAQRRHAVYVHRVALVFVVVRGVAIWVGRDVRRVVVRGVAVWGGRDVRGVVAVCYCYRFAVKEFSRKNVIKSK
jgi:hypothetical protein